jgi:polar amino acid transport system permease protein
MPADEERPPARPLIEQPGEKVGAVLLVVLVVGGFVFAVNRSRPLDPGFVWENLGSLFAAALISLGITAVAYLVGMGLGFLFGWLRTSRHRLVRGPATVWVESFRGTPLFVQLFLLFALFSYFDPGNLPIVLRLVVTGWLALTLNTSAYQGEIFRAGLQSVSAGQVEAARAIGLSYWGAMRHVVLPQAMRLVTPPLLNEFILLLKASSLLALIGVQELTYEANTLTSGGNFLEVYAAVIALYLAMTLSLSKFVGWLERRFRIPGLGLQVETPRERRGRKAPSSGVVARVFGIDAARWRGLRRPASPIRRVD